MDDTNDILLAIRTDAERGARLMVARYRTRLEAEARAFGVDAHTAEDLVFRTFERAIERIDTCRSADSFYARLFCGTFTSRWCARRPSRGWW